MKKETYINNLKKQFTANELLDYLWENRPLYNISIYIDRFKVAKSGEIANYTNYYNKNGEKGTDYKYNKNSIMIEEYENNKYKYLN